MTECSRVRVYVAGPYSAGDVEANVNRAIDAWHELHERGFSPFCPHLTHFIHLRHPKHYETWLRHDFEWLEQCQALLRLPGDSPGADREMRFAVENGILVFNSIATLSDFFVEA